MESNWREHRHLAKSINPCANSSNEIYVYVFMSTTVVVTWGMFAREAGAATTLATGLSLGIIATGTITRTLADVLDTGSGVVLSA